MSSFVISKKEYVKAAGFIAALARETNRYCEPIIYWYSYEKGGLKEAEDFYNDFVELYKANAESVLLQYNDKEAETDNTDYREEFENMMKATHRLYMYATKLCTPTSRQALINSIYEFNLFARSVNYQVEDRLLSNFCNHYLDKCQKYLMQILSQELNHYDGNSWSCFNLAEEVEE